MIYNITNQNFSKKKKYITNQNEKIRELNKNINKLQNHKIKTHLFLKKKEKHE